MNLKELYQEIIDHGKTSRNLRKTENLTKMPKDTILYVEIKFMFFKIK